MRIFMGMARDRLEGLMAAPAASVTAHLRAIGLVGGSLGSLGSLGFMIKYYLKLPLHCNTADTSKQLNPKPLTCAPSARWATGARG
jgi:hypothetical protein